MKLLKTILLLSFCAVCALSCTKSDSSDPASADTGTTTVVQSPNTFVSDCGVLVDGALENPVSTSQAVPVTATVANPYALIVQLQEGRALVKLNGLTNVESYRDNAAMNFLAKKISGQLYFYEAMSECTEFISGGGEAFVGQIYNEAGENVSEELIKAGLARIDRFDNCAVEELTSCYEALQDSSVQIGGTVSNFLWKPVSEKDGNLVVLLSPSNTTIIVNGTTLTSTGPSNGRGSTARAGKPGCAFGRASVRVFDSQGRKLLFPGGNDSYTIENGCRRTEFQ